MNSPTVFVDFMDINKPHRKKIYQSTNNYNKIFSILKEFQMKLGSTSLEVKPHSRKTWGVLSMYMFIWVCACGVFLLVLKQTIRNTLVCGFLSSLSQWHLIVKMG